jgi:hypothetical protein
LFPGCVVTSRILPGLLFSVSSLLQKTFYTNKLVKGYNSELFEGFIPDVDYFSSSIAGYADSASQFERWSSQRINDVYNSTTQSFLDRHPEYEPLLKKINVVDFPLLFEMFAVYEHLRKGLLQLSMACIYSLKLAT